MNQKNLWEIQGRSVDFFRDPEIPSFALDKCLLMGDPIVFSQIEGVKRLFSKVLIIIERGTIL
jgi:hypothetical protein